MMEKRKVEAIIAKRCRVREEINLFSKEKENQENDIEDEIDSNQTDDKYSLKL